MTHRTHTPHFAARPLGRSIRSLGCMSLLIAAAITVQSSEATAADIVNVEDFPIKVSHPMAEVELRIKKAGARRGWKMKGVGPGELEAFIFVRTHMAKVTIAFSQVAFSIRYLDSINLKHKPGKIHSAYNRWVTNLKNDIDVELSF